MADEEASSGIPLPRRPSQILVRLFSIESTQSSVDPKTYELYPSPKWEHSFKSAEFLLKIAQLITAIICTGLYSKAILLMKHSITTVMFPNVVFSAFIIITSVITISYILGHVIHEIIIRIFNSLGAILYFVAGSITGHFWLYLGRHLAEESVRQELYADMLLGQIVLTFLNSILYGADVFLSVKRTLQHIE